MLQAGVCIFLSYLGAQALSVHYVVIGSVRRYAGGLKMAS